MRGAVRGTGIVGDRHDIVGIVAVGERDARDGELGLWFDLDPGRDGEVREPPGLVGVPTL
jgi:hypothetical protein